MTKLKLYQIAKKYLIVKVWFVNGDTLKGYMYPYGWPKVKFEMQDIFECLTQGLDYYIEGFSKNPTVFLDAHKIKKVTVIKRRKI